jgi:signal transduction histidine kinase
MFKDFFRLWVRITFGSLFWIVAVQTAWVMVLLLWILAYVRPHAARLAPSLGLFTWGLVFLALMIFGLNVLVIHFARQAAQNRVVKDFVSRVSHDLRSPLASVKLHLETLLKREISPEQTRECLDAAWQDLGRLETSIEGVLMASRMERQKLRIEAHPLDLGDLLERYLARKREFVVRNGGRLHVGSLQDLWVQADPAMVERILDNLLDNALCHCPPGVRIGVSLAQKNHLALLTVADDGPGIAPREKRKIFRLFYRARAARGRGTGLGLFIVASLVKAHGGHVWVESPGVGSTFQVALPLGEEGAGHP